MIVNSRKKNFQKKVFEILLENFTRNFVKVFPTIFHVYSQHFFGNNLSFLHSHIFVDFLITEPFLRESLEAFEPLKTSFSEYFQ